MFHTFFFVKAKQISDYGDYSFRVNYPFSANFFLITQSGYVPHNTPGGFGNASAAAVAATPIMR